MRVIKFRRLDRKCQIIDGVEIRIWEIALNKSHLFAKLAGGMAEVIMPAEPVWKRMLLKLFPRRPIPVG